MLLSENIGRVGAVGDGAGIEASGGTVERWNGGTGPDQSASRGTPCQP